MDLEGVRLLLRIVSAGSIQRAAEQAGIPRSSLKRKLENLEGLVGSELVVRSTSGVRLTPAGAVVVEQGRGLLEAYERMVQHAKSAAGRPSGVLRVVAPVGVPETMRLALIHATLGLTPGLRVEEVEHSDPLAHLHEPFDLMFYFGDPPERGNWYGRVIRRGMLAPLASEAYLARHGRPTSVEDLARHRLLSWRVVKGSTSAWPLRSGGTLAVEPIHASYNGVLLHRMAAEGLGILLGDLERTAQTSAAPLIPVLEDEVGVGLDMRYLSPMPVDLDARTRSILLPILAVFDSISPDQAPDWHHVSERK